MKKEKLLSIAMLLILSIHIVSATDNQFTNEVLGFIGQTVEALIGIAGSILGPIVEIDNLGPNITRDGFVLAKVLLFFVIFSISYLGLKNVLDDSKWILLTVTLSFSILSVRFLPKSEMLISLVRPYGAVSTTLLVLGPIILAFFVINNLASGSLSRRVLWVLGGLFYLGMWYTANFWNFEGENLGEFTSLLPVSVNWVYGLGFAFILINILADRWIHRYMDEVQVNKARNIRLQQREAEYLKTAKDYEDSGEDKKAKKFYRKAAKERSKMR